MKDAFGAPQSLLLLGGTSRIGLATARRLIARRTRTVWLAGRPSPGLESAAAELRTLGAYVRTVDFDALDSNPTRPPSANLHRGRHRHGAARVRHPRGPGARRGGTALRGTGRPDQLHGAVSAGLVCAGALQEQGHGSLVVLSSVAGERARRADFIYGSSKAGLDAFAQGLGDALHGTGVHVMVVRPGSVRSGTTAGMAGAPLATTPEAVADAIVTGLRRRSETVWVPGALRVVMSALRHVPRPLFRRLPV